VASVLLNVCSTLNQEDDAIDIYNISLYCYSRKNDQKKNHHFEKEPLLNNKHYCYDTLKIKLLYIKDK